MIARLLFLTILSVFAVSNVDAAPAAATSVDPPSAPGAVEMLDATLAAELTAMWTRDADRLVSTIRNAHHDDHPLPLTFLLGIAHAETNGRILLISEAGAVGLAQATPIAYLEERMDGPLYVTREYADGARAYFLKKPLWDVYAITSVLIDDPGDRGRKRACELLQAAFRYRREGVDDLELLVPYVGESFWNRVLRDDQTNLDLLLTLERLVEEQADPAILRTLRATVYDRYQELKDEQRISWKSYQRDLVRKRDDLLRRTFHADPQEIIRTRAWEAADVLARELDDRFSPISMATFLVRHTITKHREASALGVDDAELVRVTAGLYNGGGHNIKRLRSGLLRSLTETDNYMEKVPATQQRLEERLRASQSPAPIPASR
jgi:hypothetical protein